MIGIPFTARFKVMKNVFGNIYTFFCDLTDMPVFSTSPFPEKDVRKAEEIARQQARPFFNRCSACGRWVCDDAYNIDRMQCIACAPNNSFNKTIS